MERVSPGIGGACLLQLGVDSMVPSALHHLPVPRKGRVPAQSRTLSDLGKVVTQAKLRGSLLRATVLLLLLYFGSFSGAQVQSRRLAETVEHLIERGRT